MELQRDCTKWTATLTACHRGKHLSYQRGKRNTNPNTSLIQIEGVDTSSAASFYLGKRIAYVYRGKKEIRGTKIRVIWGKVTKTHGMFEMELFAGQERKLTVCQATREW